MALAGTLLVALAPTSTAKIAVAVYAFAITGMLAASASYHRLPVSDHVRRWLRRLDHSMIGVAVAGTYTPVVVLVLDGALRTVLLGALWAGALGAMAVSMFWITAPRWVRASVYLLLGWGGAIVTPSLLDNAGAVAFALVIVGAAFYSAGAIVYALRKPNPWPFTFGFHEVFHCLVVAAVIAHFSAVVVVVNTTT